MVDCDTVEQAYKIPLSFLRKKGILKPNVQVINYRITFFINGEEVSNIKLDINTTDSENEYIRLYYTMTNTGQKIDYQIKLIRKPSNLGVGFRYYFKCPNSGVLCNVLVKPSSQVYFLSRQAFKVLYESQAVTKAYRQLDTAYFFMTNEFEDKRNKVFAKHRKHIYKGKITKYYQRFKNFEDRKHSKCEAALNYVCSKNGISHARF